MNKPKNKENKDINIPADSKITMEIEKNDFSSM